MAVHPIKLIGRRSREIAHKWVEAAPEGMLVKFQKPNRTLDQNSKLWAMLGDISKQATHNGTQYTPETWKSLFMHACDHEVKFVMGLNGEPFPMGFRSSRLNVSQMSELIEFISC